MGKKESLYLMLGVEFYPQGLLNKELDHFKTCDFCFSPPSSTPSPPPLFAFGPDPCCTYFMCVDCFKRLSKEFAGLKDNRLRILLEEGIHIDDSTI